MGEIDVAFVGNGVITIVSALQIKDKYPDLNVAIIGPTSRPFSASLAAGAMHAVFCEVEETFSKSSRDQEIFNLSLEARALWHSFLEKFRLKNLITAESTIMYCRKQGTLFEKVNFDAACEVANEYNCIEDVGGNQLEKIFCGDLKPSDVIAKKFVGEFGIDTAEFFRRAQGLLEGMGVVFIDDRVRSLSASSRGVDFILQNGKPMHAARVVIAAGTESEKILRPDFPMVPIYHGVGTSMVFDSAPETYAGLNTVVRTPNRGGAQCGMHIVPRSSGKYYLGAGNYFSSKLPAHRAETIRYLINLCEEELFGKQAMYSVKAELSLGSRPKSVDGYPVVGSYDAYPNIFVATGMYRLGLTISPVVAAEICRWYEGKPASKTFVNCSPGRQLHSYAAIDVATRYYSESRTSNLVEHGILDPQDQKAVADKRIELESFARTWNAEIVEKHGFYDDFVVDPDMYSVLMEVESGGSEAREALPEKKERHAI
jgi:glycine/D-amino acid oxidase-like deaminating enzyme